MKMRLKHAQYFSEIEYGGPGRVPAGAVLDVDEQTAARWAGLGIAGKAAASARTFQDERRERMLEALEEDGEAGDGVSRDDLALHPLQVANAPEPPDDEDDSASKPSRASRK